MKAVIIGASDEALHTIEKAKKYGLRITALDGNPKAAGLRAADKAMVVDISDEKAAVLAVRDEKPDFVLTVPIGRYLTTIGAVNDALALPGISKTMAALCTDKYKFHQKLQEEELRRCHCYEADSWKGEALDFPAVLKPRYGSGSRGIYMISDREELINVLEEVKGESYVIEECVSGEEYGVDGAVINNRFFLILIRKKENTPPPARQAVAYFSVLPEDPFYVQVQEYMKKIIACLGLKECLLHADIIRGKEEPFVIELSARPSGHNLHNLFTPLCTGVDMAEEYIKYRMGKEYNFVPADTKSMMIHYFDMHGRAGEVPSEEIIRKKLKDSMEPVSLIKWECHIKEGEILKPVFDGHSVMGRGYFILEGKDQELLQRWAEKIKELFRCADH